MALCLAESLVECAGFDPLDQMQRYVRWYREGYLSSTGACFDIGNATRAALHRFEHSGDPGSVERTAFAEMGEGKGYLVMDVSPGRGGEKVRWASRELYARPMMSVDVAVDERSGESLDAAVREVVRAAPADAVLRIRVTGELREEHLRVLRAGHVRTYLPNTMNLEIRVGDSATFSRRFDRGRSYAFRRHEGARSGAASGPAEANAVTGQFAPGAQDNRRFDSKRSSSRVANKDPHTIELLDTSELAGRQSLASNSIKV